MLHAGSLRWGRFVHRHRFLVLAVVAVAVLLSGYFGRDLNQRFTQEGWFDEASESVAAAKLADSTFGRDTDSDLILLYTAPAGRTVDDAEVRGPVTAHLAELLARYPDRVLKIDSYWDSPFTANAADAEKKHAFASVGLRGDGTATVENYLAIKDALAANDPGGGPGGTTVQLAGLQPIVEGINIGMQTDIHRAELIALPLVAILLYFVFGGVIGALLPVLIGGMTIL
ncbi:MMPL family transporter, partial [Nocardia elegans]|uniref:MMPL family transporter n=1 Tax=Nocardia elegans TaxID=300029 RepID=UPI0018959DEE